MAQRAGMEVGGIGHGRRARAAWMSAPVHVWGGIDVGTGRVGIGEKG